MKAARYLDLAGPPQPPLIKMGSFLRPRPLFTKRVVGMHQVHCIKYIPHGMERLFANQNTRNDSLKCMCDRRIMDDAFDCPAAL